MIEIEVTDEFKQWFTSLTEKEQIDVDAEVGLLEKMGACLPYPHSSKVKGSSQAGLRELRVQHAGRPYRILYAFDPRRRVILLIGGDKTGNKRWYEEMIPLAERLYEGYLEELKSEGLLPSTSRRTH